MKNTYISVTIEKSGKRCAFAIAVSPSDNLLHALDIAGISAANICQSKREAQEIAQAWNDSYRANGSYLWEVTSA